ncbi:MAG: TraB/GumN family protein [Defluviitaleaceae bacterium]|nr:TraB/GumN family protein [Defluviitaleaceae bacterium]
MSRKMKLTAALLVIMMLFAFIGACAARPEETVTYIGGVYADEAEPSGITPLMWRVTSPEGNMIYLFGSIHVGAPYIYPLPDYVMAAFLSSDYLAVEVNAHAELSMRDIMAMTSLMMYPIGTTIAGTVGQDVFNGMQAHLQANEAALAAAGLPLAAVLPISRFPVWFSALNVLAAYRAGFHAEYGLDEFFIRQASALGMPVLEVESMREQMEVLANFSPELQRALLLSALDTEEMAIGIAALFDAWAAGDYGTLLSMLLYEVEGLDEELMTEYYETILRDRDMRMAEVARTYMTEARSVFFVVGAAHFIGEGSIIYLLERAGYNVELIGAE